MNPAEAYILNQPEPYRSILMHIQIVMEQTLPEVELKYKWRMPCYYFKKKPICYLRQAKNFVDIGFWHSNYLPAKYHAYLVSENRKVVKSLRYTSLEEINDAIFVEILQEVYKHKHKSFWK